MNNSNKNKRVSLYDRVTRVIADSIALASPVAAERYLTAHDRLKKRSYAAASVTGGRETWRPKTSTGYQEIAKDGQKLRDRARDLERNNPYVAGLLRKLTINIVGEGMWPKAKIARKGTGEIDAELCRKLEEAWLEWHDQAQANGDSFSDLQRLVVRHFFNDGEVLVRVVPTRFNRFGFCLEAIEVDHLDAGKDGKTPTGNYIKGGIELDPFNRPIAYHLKPKHPAEEQAPTQRVPASEVLHIFDRQRATQVRGVCHYASIVGEIYDTLEFQDATLSLAKIATAFGIFVQAENPEDRMIGLTGEDKKDAQRLTLDPGQIHYLNPGESINSVKAEAPSGIYRDFVTSRLHSSAVGTGMSYETFSGDYNEASFSSARQAMLQERAFYRYLCGLIDAKLNYPVWKIFLTFYHSQIAALPGFDIEPQRYLKVKFSRPRQEWIDPAKDAISAKTRLELGLDTLTDMVEAEGRDIDEVIQTRVAEQKKIKDAYGSAGLLKEGNNASASDDK